MTTTPYTNVLRAAQRKLDASIKQIRDSIPHSGETGMLVEREFRSQLEEVLPEKVGVSHGFVVDSAGGVSKQMDIVLYDRMNTPRILASDGAQIFPVETTYACGEIKTKLDSPGIKDSFDKCLSYKMLERKAYHAEPSALVTTYHLFGAADSHWKSIFFCLAVESISAEELLDAYNETITSENLQFHQRIDTVMALSATGGSNMILHGSVARDPATGIPERVELLPGPDKRPYLFRAEQPWALFVMMLLEYMTRAPAEPVNMTPYGGDDPF